MMNPRWCLVCLLLVAAPRLQAAPSPKPYDVVKLAEGVYGFVWRDPLQDPIEGNALFVINDRDVLVVDTGLLPSSARRMAGALRRLTSKPVRYVVNTHWHDDHHNGNQVYRELWPGVEFVAHRNTRADMFAHTYDVRAEDLANMERDQAKYARWAATGKDDDGKPLEEPRRRRAAELAELFHSTLPEMPLRSATRRRSSRSRTSWCCTAAAAHRDPLARPGQYPRRSRGLPPARSTSPPPATCWSIRSRSASAPTTPTGSLRSARVDSLDASVLFPGHGTIQRDRNYLHQVQGLLRALVDSAKAVVADGGTLGGRPAADHAARLEADSRGRRPRQAAHVRRHVHGAGRRARVAPGARRARRRDRPHGPVTSRGPGGLRSVLRTRHVFAMIRPPGCRPARGSRARRARPAAQLAHGQKPAAPPPGYDAYVARVLGRSRCRASASPS